MSRIIAVTGSSGFIGKNLCELLKSKNYEVIEIDIEKGMNIEDSSVLDSLPNYDYIVHLAAKSFVPASFNNPYDFYKTNIVGTLNVLESARKRKSKVIFISSYLYGSPEYLPVDEMHRLAPHNPYANSKLLGEKLCEAYYNDFGVPITIFRPFNIYGKGQNENFLIPTIKNQLENKEIKLLDSKPKRDYIHISDVVAAIHCSIETELSGFECYNIGSGQSYSVEYIAESLIKINNSKANLVFSNEERKNEVLDCYANINKTVSMLNWKPNKSLFDGLKEI